MAPDEFAMKMIEDYDKYKLNVEFPSAIKGKVREEFKKKKTEKSDIVHIWV